MSSSSLKSGFSSYSPRSPQLSSSPPTQPSSSGSYQTFPASARSPVRYLANHSVGSYPASSSGSSSTSSSASTTPRQSPRTVSSGKGKLPDTISTILSPRSQSTRSLWEEKERSTMNQPSRRSVGEPGVSIDEGDEGAGDVGPISPRLSYASTASSSSYSSSASPTGLSSPNLRWWEVAKMNKFGFKQKRRFCFDLTTRSLRSYTPEGTCQTEIPMAAMDHIICYPDGGLKVLHMKILFKGNGLRPYEIIMNSFSEYNSLSIFLNEILEEERRNKDEKLSALVGGTKLAKLSKMMDLASLDNHSNYDVAKNVEEHMKYKPREDACDYLTYNVLKYSPHGLLQKRIFLVQPEQSVLRMLDHKRKVKKEWALSSVSVIEIFPPNHTFKLTSSANLDNNDDDDNDEEESPGSAASFLKNRFTALKKNVTSKMTQLMKGADDHGLSLLEAPAQIVFNHVLKQRPLPIIFPSSEDRAHFCAVVCYLQPEMCGSMDLPEDARSWEADHVRRWMKERGLQEHFATFVDAGVTGRMMIGVHSADFLTDGLGLADGFEKEKLELNIQMLQTAHRSLIDQKRIMNDDDWLAENQFHRRSRGSYGLSHFAQQQQQRRGRVESRPPPPPPPTGEVFEDVSVPPPTDKPYDPFLEELKVKLRSHNVKKRQEWNAFLKTVYPAAKDTIISCIIDYCLF